MKLRSVLATSVPLWRCLRLERTEKCKNYRSYVTTWSPLTAAFNARLADKSVKWKRNETGLFGLNELKDPTGFYLLKTQVIEASDRLIAEACSSKRSRKMVVVFDELSDVLCRLADMAEFIRVAHPDSKYASAAEDASLSINALVERLNTNQALYNALKKVVVSGDVVPTDEVDEHVAKLFLFDFEQSAIHLDKDKRERVVSLNEGLLQAGALFMRGSSTGRLLPKDGLPESVSSLFPTQGDNLLFTSLHSDSPLEMVRQAAYKVYMYPDSHQESRLNNLILGRQELAHLCGFPTFAHRVLRGSLAETPEIVKTFLDNLNKHLSPVAQFEFDAMQQLKSHENPDTKEIQMWDIPYYSSVLKREIVDFDSGECARFFSLGICMEGLSRLLHSLYGVTLQVQAPAIGEVWSDDVFKLAVVHDTEGVLGYIYLDLFERSGKMNQDCHFTIRGGRELNDGSYQLPLVVLLFNFPIPYNNTPCLLSAGMLENLFHEMGHAMHSMLARTKYQHVTGTRCSTDFAEIPSILMEYFASDSRVWNNY